MASCPIFPSQKQYCFLHIGLASVIYTIPPVPFIGFPACQRSKDGMNKNRWQYMLWTPEIVGKSKAVKMLHYSPISYWGPGIKPAPPSRRTKPRHVTGETEFRLRRNRTPPRADGECGLGVRRWLPKKTVDQKRGWGFMCFFGEESGSSFWREWIVVFGLFPFWAWAGVLSRM